MPRPAHTPDAPGLGQVDLQVTPFEFDTIGRIDRLINTVIIHFDKSKSPRTAGTAVGGKKHLDDLAHFREQCFELALGRFVTEIPNKDS